MKLKCIKCKETKNKDHFNKSKRRKTGHHIWCRNCQNKYHNKYRKKFNNENKQFISDYLRLNPCLDCNESNPIVLGFHHIGNKEYLIADLIKKNTL